MVSGIIFSEKLHFTRFGEFFPYQISDHCLQIIIVRVGIAKAVT